jgi:hypothetical protein
MNIKITVFWDVMTSNQNFTDISVFSGVGGSIFL